MKKAVTSPAKKKSVKMDRMLVSKEPHEIKYESGKMKVSAKTVKAAKKDAGRSRKAIEKKIKAG